MKRLCSAIICLCFASGALRAVDSNYQLSTEKSESLKPGAAQLNTDHGIGKLNKASGIIGSDVKNQRNENLGSIKDLMLDLQAGRVVYAVFGSGGFLGMGDKLIALPPSSLMQSEDANALLLNADRESIRSASTFDRHNWPTVADNNWNMKMKSDSQLSSSPAGVEIRESAGADNRDLKMKADRDSRASSEWVRGNKPGGKAEVKAEAKINEPAGAERTTTATPSSGEKAGWVRGKDAHAETGVETHAVTTDSASAADKRFIKAGDLMGMNVKNLQGEKLGEIEDVAVDLKSGRILYAALSSGGILGIRDRLFAVPIDALKRSPEAKTMTLDISLDALRNHAGFVKNNWPAAADTRFYGQGSGFKEPAGAEVPKSEIKSEITSPQPAIAPRSENVREQLHQSLRSDTSLSPTAQNVQVSARNGRVTLRGNVTTEDEHRRIISKAAALVGSENVDDQIIVRNRR